MVYITAAAVENTVGNNTGPYIRADINSNSGGGSTGCNGPETVNYNAGGNPPAYKLSSDAFQEFQFVFPQMGTQSTLEITAFPETNGGTKTVRIRKIRIVETAPATSFTLSPSSVNISCGSTTPITFTATGTNIPSGATVSYSWNLGTTSNGWLYNGNPAPQIISTSTTNTLTLTPVCGATQSSVSATASINSTNYNTNTSAVSVIAPSLTIQGNSSFCSGTSVYSLVGTIPCNATVTWSASPSGIVSLSPSGGSVTATKVGDGIATLTATVNACNNFAVSQPIAVGMPLIYNSYYVTNEGSSTLNEWTGGPGNENEFCYHGIPTDVVTNMNIQHGSAVWEKIYPTTFGGLVWSQDGGNLVMAFKSKTYQPIFRLTVSNACGVVTKDYKFVPVDCGEMFMVSPNPATSNITVATVENKGLIAPKDFANDKTFSEIKILDLQGNLKKQQRFNKAKQATINISALPLGIYMIEISNGKYKERHQLSVQK